MDGMALLKGRGEIEVDGAAADGAVDLCIDRAQVAMLVMRHGLILRLFRQHMRNAVHYRALLDEQQGEDKQEFREDGAQHGAHSNRGPWAFQALAA